MDSAAAGSDTLYFIDGGLPDLDALIGALPAGAHWFVLDPTRDGVVQMAEQAEGFSGLVAIHVLSHGASGELSLGNAILDRTTLDDYADELATIGRALAENGDLLIYGCDAGAGEPGLELVSRLARLTGADVAASDDPTGAASGGDWVLEVASGQIETAAFESAIYDHLLATPTSSGVVSLVALSGDPVINSLLAMSKWGGGLGSAATITYSLPQGALSYWSTSYLFGYGPTWDTTQEPWAGVTGLTLPSDRLGVEYALASWANVANLNFVAVADNQTVAGDIRIAFTDGLDPDTWAQAYFPSTTAYAGDVWLNADLRDSDFSSFGPGTFGSETLIHELGHVLGLKHPFSPYKSNSYVLNDFFDSLSFSNMSYNVAPGIPDTGGNINIYPTTPMSLDIRAVQYLYGANKTYHAGDDVYTFTSGTDYFQCIWDAGGVDVLRYDGSDGSEIDLRGGGWSDLGNSLVYSDGFDDYEDPYNVQIYDTVVIEHAEGGGGNDWMIGNSVANRLTGNAGNDTLDGGAANDTLIGGAGDDTYEVSDRRDVVVENDGEGIDLVRSRGSRRLDAGVENLELLGSAAWLGTGNALDNVVTGNLAGNRLNGGAGVDTLVGGLGRDTYLVDDADDRVVETSPLASEIDTVLSRVSYSLAGQDFVERLALTGGLAIDATGNTLANLLRGNAAANQLDGGAGADTLIGGADSDFFMFSTAVGPDNVDRIFDFAPGEDRIVLDPLIFPALAAGIDADNIRSALNATAAAEADERLIYNTGTGHLYYDADGVGGEAAVRFAVVDLAGLSSRHPASLGVDDFLMLGAPL